MRVRWKESGDREEWASRADPRLCRVFAVACDFLEARCDVHEVVVTSFFRLGDPGVHGYHRGLDLRTRTLPAGVPQALADQLNWLFAYSQVLEKKRRYQVAHFKPDAPRGPHMHLQVPPIGELVHLRRPVR